MSHVHGFPPESGPDATTLILGSMPGKESLRRGRYYAHPQNAFWKILGELLGAGPDLRYEDRLAAMIKNRIALWDVMKMCTRESSLDSDIDEESIVVNDFAEFFGRHSRIRRVFFNGARAEQAYRRYVLPRLGEAHADIETMRLPSTSPANATYSYARKLEAWRCVVS